MSDANSQAATQLRLYFVPLTFPLGFLIVYLLNTQYQFAFPDQSVAWSMGSGIGCAAVVCAILLGRALGIAASDPITDVHAAWRRYEVVSVVVGLGICSVVVLWGAWIQLTPCPWFDVAERDGFHYGSLISAIGAVLELWRRRPKRLSMT